MILSSPTGKARHYHCQAGVRGSIPLLPITTISLLHALDESVHWSYIYYIILYIYSEYYIIYIIYKALFIIYIILLCIIYILYFSKFQLVGYHQCCILIGWATSSEIVRFVNKNNGGCFVFWWSFWLCLHVFTAILVVLPLPYCSCPHGLWLNWDIAHSCLRDNC